MDKRLCIAAAVSGFLVLAGCSGSPPAATESKTGTESRQEPPKPTGPVTAKTAFYEMYKPARAWASDILPLSLGSSEIPDVKSEGGKFAQWTAVFVSPSRSEARTFTWSARGGVSATGAQSWSGATRDSRPFQLTDFLVDSDAAYQTAYEKGQAWVKKHPDKNAALTLGNASRFPAPVWYVIWGNKTSGYALFVNAMTGTPIKGK